jgi:hypothetical protein
VQPRRKIVLFELNEVPRIIIERFCEAHPASCFAEVLRNSPLIETRLSLRSRRFS